MASTSSFRPKSISALHSGCRAWASAKAAPTLSSLLPRRQLWKDANLEVKPGQFGPQASAPRRLPFTDGFSSCEVRAAVGTRGNWKELLLPRDGRNLATWPHSACREQASGCHGQAAEASCKWRGVSAGEDPLPATEAQSPNLGPGQWPPCWDCTCCSHGNTQRSYIPQGTLKQAVAYPSGRDPRVQRWVASQRLFSIPLAST